MDRREAPADDRLRAAGGVTAPKDARASGVAARPDFAAAQSGLRLLWESVRRQRRYVAADAGGLRPCPGAPARRADCDTAPQTVRRAAIGAPSQASVAWAECSEAHTESGADARRVSTALRAVVHPTLAVAENWENSKVSP